MGQKNAARAASSSGAAHQNASAFRRANIGASAFDLTRAHGGDGEINVARVLERADVAGPLNFIDVAVLPPGTSIGRHCHADDEEEYYLILDGTGRMRQDGASFDVAPGDLIRNGPGQEHELENTGSTDLRVFVFELGLTG